MHNRKPDGLESREIGLREGIVVGALVACILALAVYPQLILKRTDASAVATITRVGFNDCEGDDEAIPEEVPALATCLSDRFGVTEELIAAAGPISAEDEETLQEID